LKNFQLQESREAACLLQIQNDTISVEKLGASEMLQREFDKLNIGDITQ